MAFYDNRSLTVFSCPRCIQLRGKFNYYAGEFNPGPTPPGLVEFKLSFVEEQLIAAVSVTQFIYFRRGGQQMATKGHCISFHQNVASLARQLPRTASECPILIVRKRTGNYTNAVTHDLRVRRAHVEYWLKYCQDKHPSLVYRSIVISQERLDLLPEDGSIPLAEVDGEDDLIDELQSHQFNEDLAADAATSRDTDCESSDSEAEPDQVAVEDQEEVESADLNPASSSGIQLGAEQMQNEDERTLDALNGLFGNTSPADEQTPGKYNKLENLTFNITQELKR